jgi:uncharacterized surface protein with fasciclin (FAS1) repeats
MNKRTLIAGVSALAFAAGALSLPASATATELRTAPLAGVLAAETPAFDSNALDYDIVTAAVLAVIQVKPTSSVTALADGTIALTAFIPNDNAFRLLAKELTGKTIKSEKRVFDSLVKTLGVDKVEQVLLYHVVVGSTLDVSAALAANGAELTTASTGKIKVSVGTQIKLIDETKKRRDASVILSQIDVNKGNKQIAHGIDFVMLPKF